jgi:hypothetical protein
LYLVSPDGFAYTERDAGFLRYGNSNHVQYKQVINCFPSFNCMSKIKIVELNFECIWGNKASLPAFPANLLRGLIGSNLRRMLCITKKEFCEGCSFIPHCKYPRWFPHLVSSKKNDSELPPFILKIIPFDTIKSSGKRFNSGSYTIVEPGDLFSFSVVIVANDYPYLIHVVREIGSNGIGRKGERASFVLKRVLFSDNEIYNSSVNNELSFHEPVNVDFQEMLRSIHSVSPEEDAILKINFESPLRFKHKNKLCDYLDFRMFMMLCFRRVQSIIDGFAPKSLEFAIHDSLYDEISKVLTVNNELSWNDWTRYSFYQKTSMQLGGIIGEIEFKGPVKRYLPLISFCSRVHIGKQGSFGLGHFRINDS